MPLLLTGYEPFISYCCIYNGYIYYHGVKCSLAFQHKIAFRQKMKPRVYVMREKTTLEIRAPGRTEHTRGRAESARAEPSVAIILGANIFLARLMLDCD